MLFPSRAVHWGMICPFIIVHKLGQPEAMGKYLPQHLSNGEAEHLKNGVILSLYPHPLRSAPQPPFVGFYRHPWTTVFTTRRTHQSTAWENAAIMSSLVSFGGEELTMS